MIDYLPANPSVTVKTLAAATGFSERRCGDALRRLEAAKVVKGRTVGPSVRVYDADKVFDAFNVMSSTVCDPPRGRTLWCLPRRSSRRPVFPGLVGCWSMTPLRSASSRLSPRVCLAVSFVGTGALQCRHLPHRKSQLRRTT